MRPKAIAPPVVSLVSLGCAKNTVDSERLLAALVSEGFLVAEDPADADVCLVNTCGFIADAREETEETLAALSALKNREGRPSIVALGCLVQLAGQQAGLAAFLAAADARVGFADYERLPHICRDLCAGAAGKPPAPGPVRSEFHRGPRLLTGAGHAVALKISEGCANGCRFCSIPAIRGPQVSRPIEEVVAEAEDLMASGAREIDLIAQDTTAYGRDLYGRRRLADLLHALAKIRTDAWFRLLYAHPRHLDEATVEVLASGERFCPYLDMPLQHIHDRILRAMGRGMGRPETLRLLDRLAERWPGIELRSAFIVGFPGETEAEFEELCRFAEEGRILYAGVFRYSREEGTPAAGMPDPVPPAVAEARRRQLASVLVRASERRLNRYRDHTVPVMIDRRARREDGARRHGWAARTRFQAPDVDGVTWVPPRRGLVPGTVIDVCIDSVHGVDLIGR